VATHILPELNRMADSMEVKIRPAHSSDTDPVSELLSEAGLIALDTSAQFGPQYAVAVDKHERFLALLIWNLKRVLQARQRCAFQ
jgi:hypothetical protein